MSSTFHGGGPRVAALLYLATSATPAAAQVAVHSFPGILAGQEAGRAIASAGDLDGDGVPDLLLGHPYATSGSFQCGVVELRSGASGSLIGVLQTGAPGERFGAAVCSAGDFDGDGWPDVLVGAPGFGGGRGKAQVFSGKDKSILWTRFGAAAGDGFGTAVALAGAVDAQPGHEFAVGAPLEGHGGVAGLGRVHVYSGGSGVEIAAFGATFAPQALSSFGAALAGGLDWNGDGIGDLVVGAPNHAAGGSSGGMVAVFSGSGAPLAWWTGAAGSELGASVGVAGDADGDGRAEVLAGAPASSLGGFDSGLVIVYGSASAGIVPTVILGEPGSRLGTAVAGCGDLDGDGRGDLVAGAPRWRAPSGLRPGRASLHSAHDGTLLASIEGLQLDGRFGTAVAGAGDLNGDGAGDFAAGEPLHDGLAQHAGLVRVFLGAAPLPEGSCVAKTNSLGCTPQLEWSGAPSLSTGAGFHLRASGVLSSTQGMVIWSFAPASLPFAGGTLCVGAPIHRTPVQSSGGSAVVIDCSGSYDFVFTPQRLVADGMLPGSTVHCQFWSRDPGFAPPENVGLTGGLSFRPVP